MKNITFECGIVTPMFLAGADGRTPEIRPPSIKGAMRFWWRAMNGYLSIKELKKKETDIFGGSGEGEGKSKFNIRIFSNSLKTQKYSPVPHSNTKKFTFNGIIPGQKISMILSSKYDKVDEYTNILKVSIILGGLGKRARRGFGSVRILNVGGKPSNSEYKLEEILKLINIITDNKYQIKEDKIVLINSLTARYPFLKEIQIGRGYDSWEYLLKNIGGASHNHNIDSLGFAHGKRLSSPIYVSVLKNSSKKYLPIISSLNTVFKDGGRIIDNEGQNDFKEEIL